MSLFFAQASGLVGKLVYEILGSIDPALLGGLIKIGLVVFIIFIFYSLYNKDENKK